MPTQVLNVSYIGNGKSTNRYHIPFVLTRPNTWRIRSVYERHPGHSKWPYLDGVTYTDDLDAVLGDDAVDLVVVCTMHDSHYEYAMKALEAGKNVLVEKPFTLTVAQAEQIFAYAAERGLFVSANQNRRFDADFLTLKKVIEEGALGKVYEIDQAFDYWRPEVPEGVHEFSPYQSFVYGHAVHTVDQAVSLFGIPDSVRYDVRQILGEGRMNDYYDIDLMFGDLRYTVRASYFRALPRPSFAAYGTKGAFIRQSPDRQEEHLKLFYLPGQPGFGDDRPQDLAVVARYDENGAYHEEKVPSVHGDYARMYDSIYDTLVNGTEQLVKPEETLAVMHILENAVSHLS